MHHDHTRPPMLSGEPFKADPHPTYAWLRENAPVFCRTSADGQARLWLLTRYDDVAAALRDPQRFVKDVANTMTPAERAAQPEPPPLYRLLTHHMLNADGADHARLRGLVNRAFSARRVEKLEPLLFTSAHRLIDRALKRGQMDLIADFSLPFAVEAIAAMLGVGAADHGRLRAWSHVLVAPSASSERNERKTARLRAAMEDFVAYLDAASAARRRLPQLDLISALLAAEGTGDSLTPEEFYSMILLLIVVGHETSVYLVGNLVLTLLLQRELWDWLRATPAQIPAAVEELIRFDGPVERATMRFAAEGGRTARADAAPRGTR
jgi:cytochrome P450